MNLQEITIGDVIDAYDCKNMATVLTNGCATAPVYDGPHPVTYKEVLECTGQ